MYIIIKITEQKTRYKKEINTEKKKEKEEKKKKELKFGINI